MSQLNAERKTLEVLAEDFVARYRRGERPALSEYVNAHPELAAEIRELFPTLVMMEALAPSDSDSVAEPSAPVVQPPKLSLGDYRILREIGRGGMGIVYEAEQLSLGRRVALKVLRQAAGDTITRQRFHREARAAAQLHHTNIVPVFEVGEDRDACWYAMQLIHGQGLDQIIEELRQLRCPAASRTSVPSEHRPLSQVTQSLVNGQFAFPDLDPSTPPPAPVESSPETTIDATDSERLARRSELSAQDSSGSQYYRSVARIGRQAGEAPAHAHARGILHRDIKPSNLLLDTAGVVWITDFGLAKTQDCALTTTGDVVGTVRYMAPERLKGEGDERSDVYALGLTLYELLVLRPAFEARDRLELIDRIKNEEPPRPRSLDKRVSRDLETIILKAIDKEAKRRYQKAEAMAEDLRRFLANEPIQARRTSELERLRLWSRRNPAVASLLSVVVLLMTCLTTGSIIAALWVNEKNKALNSAEEDRTEQLYQSLVAQANASRFSHQVGQRYGTLEAVRKAAALVRERHMPAERLDELRNLAIAALVLPDLRTLKTWERIPGGTHTWSADDQLRRYARGDVDGNISLRWIDTDEEIARLEGWRGEFGLHFSPGGRFLVTWLHFESRSRVWDVSLAQPRIVQEGEQYGFTFHPDGRHLLANQRNGSLLVYDLEKPNRKPSILTTLQPCFLRFFAYDPSGKRLATVGNGKVQILNAKTGEEEIVVPESQPYETPAWHPSGNYLALVCSGHDIHVWDLKRMKRMSILKGCRNGGVGLAFTPDGERLLSRGWEGIVRLWDWRTGRQVLQQPGDPRFPCRADGRLLIGEGSRLSLVEFNTGREYRSFVQQSHAGSEVEYKEAHIHPEGRVFVVAMSDSARLFNLQSGEELASLPVPGYGNHFPDKEVLLTSGAGCLLRWPIQVDQDHPNRWCLGPPKLLHVGTGSKIGCDKKGSVIGQANPNNTGAFLVRPGKATTFLGPHADCRNVAISPNGKYAATFNHHGDVGIKVWETDTGKLIVRFPVGGEAFAAFSPDGQWLSVAGSRGCRMVKVGSWEERPFDSRGIFSPDSLLLAVTANPGVIRLLELATGRELARLADPNQSLPEGLTFTPDGGKLVDSSDAERAIHVWDLRAIRAQLAEMGLDWDAPPLPPAPPISPEPLQIQVDLGNLRQLVEAASLVQQAGKYERSNKHQDALAALRKAARLAPEYATAHNNLAWLLLAGPKKLRDSAQALVEARKAVELESCQWTYFNTLGVALCRERKFAEAVPVLERSLREGKGQGDAFDLFFLAICHHRLRDAAKAKECLDRGADWFQQHKNQIPASWIRELTEFQAEAETALAEPPGQAKE